MADLLELVAQGIHNGWCEYKKQQGVVWGEERTETTHPHLIEWNKLDNESQNQDRFIAARILEKWLDGTIHNGSLPEAIHNSWVTWIKVNRREHPHAHPFGVAHPEGAEEHELQAKHISQILPQ